MITYTKVNIRKDLYEAIKKLAENDNRSVVKYLENIIISRIDYAYPVHKIDDLPKTTMILEQDEPSTTPFDDGDSFREYNKKVKITYTPTAFCKHGADPKFCKHKKGGKACK